MDSSRRRFRTRLGVVRLDFLLWTMLLTAVGAGLLAAPLHAQPSRADEVCGAELWDISFAAGVLPYPEANRVMRVTHTAQTLFRFHRTGEALRKLDTLLERLDTLRGACDPADECAELKTAVRRVRECVATKQPPRLATLTVETFEQDDTKPDGRGARLGWRVRQGGALGRGRSHEAERPLDGACPVRSSPDVCRVLPVFGR